MTNKNMRSIILLVALLLRVECISAQYNKAENYVKGSVHFDSSNRFEGFIYHTFADVEMIQSKIIVVTPETYDSIRLRGRVTKKDLKTYNPKEVNYYELNDGTKYYSQSYSDFTAIGPKMIPKEYFFELVVDGDVKLFKRYIPLREVSVAVRMKDGMTLNQLASVNKSSYEFLIRKKEEKLKNISNVSLLDYIDDNQITLEKFNADIYGKVRQVFSRKIKYGSINHADYENELIRLFRDYNQLRQ